MDDVRIDAEANRLLLAVGGYIEQWILDHARASVGQRSQQPGERPTINVDDIRASFGALVNQGLAEIEQSVVRGRRTLISASQRTG